MDKQPIAEILETTLSKIREMIDVNTVIGQPIDTADGTTLIPVSRLSFGFASGGADTQGKDQRAGKDPFCGGAGAGVKVTPVAFLIVKDGNVRALNILPPADTTVDRLLDIAPEIVDKISEVVDKYKKN